MDAKQNQSGISAQPNFGAAPLMPHKNNINPNPFIVVNLRECKYDIFRRVSQDHFKWETLLSQEYYLQQKKASGNPHSNANSCREPGDGCDSDSNQLATTATSSTLAVMDKQSQIQTVTSSTAHPSTIQNVSQVTSNRHNLRSSKRYLSNFQQHNQIKNQNEENNHPSQGSQNNNTQNEKQQSQQPIISYQWDILWFDHGGLTPEFLSSMLPWQRVNHFLGMYNIARKNTLGIHLKRFLKEFPKDYKFFPNTWLYPAEFFEINEYYMQKSNKRKQMIKDGEMTEEQSQKDPIVLFICKPEASCQGKGIFIVKRLDDMRLQLNSQLQAQLKQYQEYLQAQEYYDTALMYSQKQTPATNSTFLNQGNGIHNVNLLNFSVNQDQSQIVTSGQQMQNGQGTSSNAQSQNQVEAPQIVEKQNTFVIQKYMKHPALINGHKFDFRIYVLITSVIDPLSIFMFKDGLVRLASEKYKVDKNIQDMYTHLTNYSLNKKNQNFDGNKHKLTLSECLRGRFSSSSVKGTFAKQSEQIWLEIEDIVIKTIITIQPQLQHYYRSSQPKEPDLCYELLGFDIILDYKLRPWLLEVNHLPSFNSDTPTDEQVKYELIRDVFSILQLSIEHRKKVHKDLKAEQLKQSQHSGCFKRLTVKEHVEKVRFDPFTVERLNPQNKFKLIYPKPTQGGSSEGDGLSCYEKYQKKANEIWQMTTGTFRQQIPQSTTTAKDEKKKKKPLKSRHRKQSQQLQQQTVEQIAAQDNKFHADKSNIEEDVATIYKDSENFTELQTEETQKRYREEAQVIKSDSGQNPIKIRKEKESLQQEGGNQGDEGSNAKNDEFPDDQNRTSKPDNDKANKESKLKLTQNTFFEKRQSSNMRPSTNISSMKQSTKQNTQRQQTLRSNMKHTPVSNLRGCINHRNLNINNFIRHHNNHPAQSQPIEENQGINHLASSFGIRSNELISYQDMEKMDSQQEMDFSKLLVRRQQSLNEEGTQEDDLKILTLSSPQNPKANLDSDSQTTEANSVMMKLSQNRGTLKYKEYCKALIDEFNQAYYKSTYKSSQAPKTYEYGSQQAVHRSVGLMGQNKSVQAVSENSRSINQASITHPQQHGKTTLISNYISSKRTNKIEAVSTSMGSNHLKHKFVAQNQHQIRQYTNTDNRSMSQYQPHPTQGKIPGAQILRYQIEKGVGDSDNEALQSPAYQKIYINSSLNKNQPYKSQFSHQDPQQQSSTIMLQKKPYYNLTSSFQDQIQNKFAQQKAQIQSTLVRSKEDLPAFTLGSNNANDNKNVLTRSDSFKDQRYNFRKSNQPVSALEQKILNHIYVSNGLDEIGGSQENLMKNLGKVGISRKEDQINPSNTTFDIASIDLSAGIQDFKISYKKHSKRLNPGVGNRASLVVTDHLKKEQHRMNEGSMIKAGFESNKASNKPDLNSEQERTSNGIEQQQQQLLSFNNFVNSPPQIKLQEGKISSISVPHSSLKGQLIQKQQLQKIRKDIKFTQKVNSFEQNEHIQLDRLRQFEQKLLMNHSQLNK